MPRNLANDNRIVRVNKSLSLSAVAPCAMSLALINPSVPSPASCIITGRRFLSYDTAAFGLAVLLMLAWLQSGKATPGNWRLTPALPSPARPSHRRRRLSSTNGAPWRKAIDEQEGSAPSVQDGSEPGKGGCAGGL